jgi:PadR family transcriptional regulator, regulatory protein PadR
MPPADSKPDAGELVVLSLLSEEPLYGYAITKLVAARSDDRMRLPPGLLYPLLAKMESQGLIASTWDEVRSERAGEGAGGRKRKWYRLTAKGQKRLRQGIEAHRRYQAIIDRFIPSAPRTEERGHEA